MENNITKIAIIGPSFFSYINSIRDEFSSRGVECDFIDERHSNDIITKLLYRLNWTRFIQRSKDKYLALKLKQIEMNCYTDILLIGVEVIDKEYVNRLKLLGVRVHIYMWDSSTNKPGFVNYLDELTGCGSFDLDDCNKLGMQYIPLFAEGLFSSNQYDSLSRDIEISFCGTVHSDRAMHLRKLKKLSKKLGFRLQLLLFFHSKFLFFLKSFTRLSNIYFLSSISTIGFSKEIVSQCMHRSKFVFDIQHKGQRGLTARTFEALQSGACLITFNKDANNLPFGLQKRIIVIDDIEGIEKIDFIAYDNIRRLSPEQEYFVSISRFIDDLSNMMGIDISKG